MRPLPVRIHDGIMPVIDAFFLWMVGLGQHLFAKHKPLVKPVELLGLDLFVNDEQYRSYMDGAPDSTIIIYPETTP